ncbi:hypothetical protein EST38_g5866 [Candolleomyces aberdarensis]|uniref:Uncharacterized protein n=1 Tax=Candolleomyces aberdarensis TaxID=2316362 RepID=A0A4Q2DJE8_9AGAR|nr:hypothetical protein EST38_g5866 [Candolleomyces aberdarensis]
MALFKNLSKLEKIAIWRNHETLSKFLKALKEDGASPGAPSFPALRSVELQDIDFDEERTGGADDAVRTLITAFEHREAYEPIEQVVVTRCINFSWAHWENLSNSLSEKANMHWDKEEDMRELSEHDEEEGLSDSGLDWLPPGAHYDSDDDYCY